MWVTKELVEEKLAMFDVESRVADVFRKITRTMSAILFQKSIFKRTLETSQICFFLFIFGFFTLVVPITLTYLILYTSFWWLALLYLVWAFVGVDSEASMNPPWEAMRNHPFWDHTADYFPLKIVKTAELSPKNNYLFGWHPHGIVGVSAVAVMCTDGAGFRDKFPGITRYVTTLTWHFKFPLRRHIMNAFGVIPVSFKPLTRVLSRPGGGNGVTVIIGGADEAMECHPKTYKLCINRRRGFCRAALVTGAHLVPVFAFGENDTYRQVPNPKGSLIRAIQTKVKYMTGISPVMAYGTNIIPFVPGVIPLRTEINVVFGEPIPVTKTKHPTWEQIDELHKTYKQKLEALFEAHKTKYGVSQDTHIEFY
ncbi:unnamed protein product [Bursaphelenchus xylophilus]|uniref:Acyltransferase n=1 Tax=Bursaphelenchus xylophilus TaxID=6326 RepID=A0A1I7RIN4_BURXY|nr:unnamed protein product [Bursaphelenchus xylophilus]CAG9118945.1 unnamed protein product [Bursaphelenchus xylophilus]